MNNGPGLRADTKKVACTERIYPIPFFLSCLRRDFGSPASPLAETVSHIPLRSPPILLERKTMTVVNFPPTADPEPLRCEECDGAKFFVYTDHSLICSNCGTVCEWDLGGNGDGQQELELVFTPDEALVEEVTTIRHRPEVTD